MRAGRRTRSRRRSTSDRGVRLREVAQHPCRARDRVVDAVSRVEGVEGVLEDDLDPAARLRRARPRLSRPARSPASGSGRQPARAGPATQRAIVVLPLPDSPTSATHSPAPSENDTSSAATTCSCAAAVHRPQTLDREQRRGRAHGPLGRTQRKLERRAFAATRSSARAAPSRCPRAAGSALSHRSTRCGQRGAKAQPGGRSPTPTATARHADEPARRAVVGDRSRRARACTDAAAGSRIAAAGPSSTTRPAYMTAIRSATWATTARSCETYTIASPRSRRRRSISSRTRAWVTTSSPVVGSSSTTSGGSQDERDRDRHALLLAARELVRVAAQEGVVGGQVDALQRSAGGTASALGRVRASMSCTAARCAGPG